MDWEKEFAYLTARNTLPSESDLYNSLRSSGLDKVQATALAALFVATFERIQALERKTPGTY